MLDHASQTIARISSLTEGETDVISNMATVACELFLGDHRIWAHGLGLGPALGMLSLVGMVIAIGAALYDWPKRQTAIPV